MSATVEQVRAAGASRSDGWLYGRWLDLLVGCGFGYLLSIPLLFLLTVSGSLREWPLSIVMGLALLVNGPHYGATILRAYDAREDRQKYFVFAVYITLALWGLFAISTHSRWLASALITVYATWTPWHFSGQNYGLALMFLRRRGVDVDPGTKRVLYASFVLSALIAILAIHGGHEGFVFSPRSLPVPNVPGLIAFGLPAALAGPLKLGLILVYLGCIGVAAARLLRRATPTAIAPAFLLVLSQALWFTVPAMFLSGGVSRTEGLVFSAVWVNAAHSLQYLWVTAYYARSSAAKEPAPRFLLKALLAGTAVSTLPGLVMAPHLIGSYPWDAGLAATLFAVVNLHHFVLDGAIWKLRDGRVARVLLRSAGEAEREGAGPSRSRWPRRLVWAGAALSLLIPAAEIYGRLGLGRVRTPEEIGRLTQVLRWTGRETTQMHERIGSSYARRGKSLEAIEHYRRSLELFPTARVWGQLGGEYRKLGQWGRARAAYEEAVALNPEFASAHVGRAQAVLKLSSGKPEEAVASLERALALQPGLSGAAVLLAQQYEKAGRPEQAVATLERSLAAERQSDPATVERELARLGRGS